MDTSSASAEELAGGIAQSTPAAAALSDGLRVDRLICVGLAILTLLVFKQTLGFRFVNFDDDAYVYENQDVAGGLTLPGVVKAFTGGSRANWDPLTTLSHMLDCQLYGLRPGGHHLTNVLLHAASVILLFCVLLRMTGARWPSAFAAALFAIHPLRAESVAWVTERKDVLSGLFFMLTLGAYVRYVRRPPRRLNYLLVVFCFALGLMSKAMLVTLPLVLLLLDYWPLNRLSGPESSRPVFLRLLVEKIPLLALSLFSSVAAILAQSGVHAVQSFERFPFSLRIANALVSVVMYLAQMFFPVDLAVYYPYPEHGLPPWQIGGALLVVVGISAAAWRWRRERPYLLVGWLWNLVMLAPVIGLIQLGQQARADRYTYLPQIGLYVALSWLAGSLLPRWPGRRALLATAGSLAVMVLSLCAARQTSYWRDSVQLWERCLAVTSDNALAYYNYGLALVQRGQPGDAVAQFEQTLKLKPGDFAARRNLGSALFQTGQLDEAITQLKAALKIVPTNASTHLNLGNVYAQKKLTNDAISEYETALRLDPNYADAEYTLGYVLLKSGRVDDSINHLERALKLEPGLVNARFNLATALLRKGSKAGAIEQFKRILELQPGFAPAQQSLNDLAWRMATSPIAAERDGATALDLANGLAGLTQGKQPAILRTLAAACAETGKFADAIAAADEALQLAQRANDAEQTAQLQEELAQYHAGLPYRDIGQAPSPAPN